VIVFTKTDRGTPESVEANIAAFTAEIAPWFEKPPEIVAIEVDPLTGKPVPRSLTGKRPVLLEKFLRDHAPQKVANSEDYDASGRVLLPTAYAGWLAGPDNWLGAAAVASDRPMPGDFRILSPVSGTTLLLDPDLPDGGRRLPLRTTAPAGEVEWSSQTLKTELTARGVTALLESGEHTLTARHKPSGETRTTVVKVQRL